MVKDAILRTTQAANLAGIRAILVHAKDEKARAFYEQFDFEPSPLNLLQLLLLMKDARRAMGVAAGDEPESCSHKPCHWCKFMYHRGFPNES